VGLTPIQVPNGPICFKVTGTVVRVQLLCDDMRKQTSWRLYLQSIVEEQDRRKESGMQKVSKSCRKPDLILPIRHEEGLNGN